MLYESDVIDSVCDLLMSYNYSILQKLGTNETGEDIIAEKDGLKIYIEAKGETSSKNSTNRYGKPFSSSQVFTHVSKALFKAVSLITKESEAELKSGMAFPKTNIHISNVNKIKYAIEKLGIIVFMVDDNKKAEVYIEKI